MKRTIDGRVFSPFFHSLLYQWAHVSCALWIPEGMPLHYPLGTSVVFFLDPDGRDMINIFKIAERRWTYVCCRLSGTCDH